MGESNTRMWWRTRIKAIQDSAGEISAEDWLGELMKVPELKLAEFADSDPNYRLAVVDATDMPIAGDIDFENTQKGLLPYRRVIKMEVK